MKTIAKHQTSTIKNELVRHWHGQKSKQKRKISEETLAIEPELDEIVSVVQRFTLRIDRYHETAARALARCDDCQ
jgi:hypothetical protein